MHASGNVASADHALPDPVPLRDVIEPPPFPVQCLARWQREWVEGEACATQTPVDLAAMLTLVVTATSSAPRFRVQVNSTWVEQLNIYVAAALPPASRKSAVVRDAIEPLQEFERRAAESMAAEIDRVGAMVRSAERRLRALEEAVARAKGGDSDKASNLSFRWRQPSSGP